MPQVVIHRVKADKRNYEVELHIYKEGYHICAYYEPIPTREIRKEIDEKITKFVTYKFKNMG